MIYTLVFVFGLIIGSFLNCLIWRLRKKEGIMNRSYCPKCKTQINWHDNIPLLSFIFLMGKCRKCKQRISWQYPLVELATGILFLLAFFINYELRITNNEFFNLNILSLIHNSSFIIQLLRDWFFISVMIIVFVYDLKWYLILDVITLPACFVVFFLNLWLGFSWLNLLVSGIIGAGFFLSQFLISRGKWIGGGDIRLGLLMGLALGWPSIITAIFLAYLIGGFAGIILIMAKKKKLGSHVPLGIFLTSAAVAALFYGEKIFNWYISYVFNY
jgi:prepilin signal peptidase PulO-like enzyme (type II secretory pathway)